MLPAALRYKARHWWQQLLSALNGAHAKVPPYKLIPPQFNLVGANQTTITPYGTWVEQISPDRLIPQNLYLAQVARRRSEMHND